MKRLVALYAAIMMIILSVAIGCSAPTPVPGKSHFSMNCSPRPGWLNFPMLTKHICLSERRTTCYTRVIGQGMGGETRSGLRII